MLRVAASVLLALPLATVLATGLRSVGSADLASALLARADLIEAVYIAARYCAPDNSAAPYYFDVLRLIGEVRS